MKKSICLLIYDLRSGGAERVLSQWSTLLAEDYNVYMTLFDKDAKIVYPYSGQLTYLDGKANNRNFFTKVMTVLKRARSLKHFVKKNNIDLVLSFCNECNLVNTISDHKAKKVCSIRSASDLSSNPFVKLVLYSRKNKIIIQTEALKATMIEQYGAWIEQKLIVFGNPFNTKSIRLLAQEPAPEHLIPLLNNNRCIVSVASFKPQKNHANLLKSFELICQKIDDVCLLLVGADSTGLKKKVAAMAATSKYKDRIFFSGELENPYAVMSKSAIFVLPSLAEGIPNVLAEAMICGLPVVASNCPTGPAELLCDDPSCIEYDSNGCYEGDYGLLVKPFKAVAEYNYRDFSADNQNFAHAVSSLLDDPIKMETFRKKALHGSQKFDLEQYQVNLIALVQSFL